MSSKERAIRRSKREGYTVASIARRYGVTIADVRSVLAGESLPYVKVVKPPPREQGGPLADAVELLAEVEAMPAGVAKKRALRIIEGNYGDVLT